MPKIDLTSQQRIELLEQLRDARALIQRDAEAFQRAALTLEHLGQVIGGKIRFGLQDYKEKVLSLFDVHLKEQRGEASRLFDVVRESRNTAVHDGAWIRHLNTRLIDLFLLLENAILSEMRILSDVMVRSPVVAEPWHLVAHARKLMLSNAFSTLPIFIGGEWNLLTDEAIAHGTCGHERKTRNKLLSTPIEEAVGRRWLVLNKAEKRQPDQIVVELFKDRIKWPLLVVDKIGATERLIGIVTPFDLL